MNTWERSAGDAHSGSLQASELTAIGALGAAMSWKARDDSLIATWLDVCGTRQAKPHSSPAQAGDRQRPISRCAERKEEAAFRGKKSSAGAGGGGSVVNGVCRGRYCVASYRLAAQPA